MQNQSKTITISKPYNEILGSIDRSTLVNAYFGGSNLLADYLNDYSSDGTNEFIGEFIDLHWGKPYMQEYPYTASELIENPNVIIEGASMAFFYALGHVLGQDVSDCETIFKNSKMSFRGSNSFYIFANPWSNACCNYYIIREDSYSEAIEELVTTFESAFLIENQDETDQDTLYNDNGEPVNIDYLVYLGEIQLTE